MQAMPWFTIDLRGGVETIELGASMARLSDCEELRLLLVGDCFETPHHRAWVVVPIRGRCPVEKPSDR
jgi:hypothetical protein